MLRSVFSIVVLGAATAWGASECTRGPAVPAATATAVQTCLRGRIVLVQKSRLVVSVTGQHIRFRVADDAKIRVNGIEATLQDLKPRYAVTIVAEMKGEEPIAKYVEAAMRM